jgi:hypothetical protein
VGTGCGAEAPGGGGVSVGNKANGVGGVGGVSVISDAVGVGAGDTSSTQGVTTRLQGTLAQG